MTASARKISSAAAASAPDATSRDFFQSFRKGLALFLGAYECVSRPLFAGLIGRFGSAREGNIAVMTALLLLPMIGLAGLGIDYASAVKTKGRLEQIAQTTATLAASVTRNYLQLAGPNNAQYDAQAIAEGRRVAIATINQRLASVSNMTYDPTSLDVTVKRLGNTVSSTVNFNVTVPTGFAQIFGVNSFAMPVNGQIIMGMQDNPANATITNSIIDEKWTSPVNNASMTDPTTPVLNDWYSGTPGSGSPVLPAGSSLLSDGTQTMPSAIQVGVGSSAKLISKKVFMLSGNYELRYWYRSSAVYPEYEPVYVCGTVESEMSWVVSPKTRSLSSLPGSPTTTGPAQGSRAGIYLDPILVNPQSPGAMTPPTIGSFPSPPDIFPGYPGASMNASRPDYGSTGGHVRVDICAYSSRWIQRSVQVQITTPGYFWLSAVSEPPGNQSSLGFYLGRLQLCQNACSDAVTTYWPWTAGTTLYENSFETPSHTNGDILNVSDTTGFTAASGYESPPPWLIRIFGGSQPPQSDEFFYNVTDDPRQQLDGRTSVNSKRLGTRAYRRVLLMPGIYKFSFMVNVGQPPDGINWCPVAPNPAVPGTNYYIPQDTCFCAAGSIYAGINSDEFVYQTSSNYFSYHSAPPAYASRWSANPLGSCMQSGVVKIYNQCVIISRTQIYGFDFHPAGPYLPDSSYLNFSYNGASYSYPDLNLGTGGAQMDKLKLTVLHQGLPPATADPVDYLNLLGYQDPTSPNFCGILRADGRTVYAVRAPSSDNIVSGGIPAWPGYFTKSANGVTVTAPSMSMP